MGTKPKDLEIPQLSDIALIWDNEDNDWVIGYRKDFAKHKTHRFVDNVTFDATDEAYTSDPFECAGYDKFLLLINLDVIDTPTDIVIAVEFSDGEATWYKYMRGPFGDLRYEDDAGDKKECIDGVVRAKQMRVVLTSSGCSGTNKFRVTIKAILTG